MHYGDCGRIQFRQRGPDQSGGEIIRFSKGDKSRGQVLSMTLGFMVRVERDGDQLEGVDVFRLGGKC